MNWQSLKAQSVDEIVEWAEAQPWAKAMADCQQDSEWHAEGDVWTHTKMVCRELILLDEWTSLSKDQQLVLLFTALFHDSAKPLTSQTDPENGRVTSPKHAVKGEFVARNTLRQLRCKLSVREQICRMVRYHGRPAFLLEKESPANEIIRMSWLVENRLLYLFALADTRGRVTQSFSRPEENLHYWKLQAEELNCFRQPYPFANDHARFLFFRNSDPDIHYVPHEEYRCQATLVCGLPGSGKDSWIAKLGGEGPVISLDEVRAQVGCEPTENQGQVIHLAREKCRELLRAEKSFIFNATNTVKQTRSKWIDLFADYGAQIKIVYVEPAIEKLLEQNRSRTQSVPESVVLKLAEKCEPPTWLESHQLELLEEF